MTPALHGLVPMRAGPVLAAIQRYGAKRTAKIDARREARIAELMGATRNRWSWRRLAFVASPRTRDQAVEILQSDGDFGLASEWDVIGWYDWQTAQQLSEVGLALGAPGVGDMQVHLSTRTVALLVDYL